MKILSIRVPLGYKMLSKNFDINFMTKTRVNKDIPGDELLKLENNFYYPIETVFIGKNSSGKSSVLELIDIAYEFIETGRIENIFFTDKGLFEIEIVFYYKGFIYKYCGTFTKEVSINKEYLVIKKETLGKTSMKESYKKDLSNAYFVNEKLFLPCVDGDTSMIPRIIDDTGFNISLDKEDNRAVLFGVLFNNLGKETFDALVHLFDDSVEFIEPYKENNETNGFRFKRIGMNEAFLVNSDYLESFLSDGTIRGINLYGLAIIAFKIGGTLIIDEIEKNFNRNLIENLLMMFKDKSINKANASIVYSTHYSELLDTNNRCDNVNVLHREGTVITLKNMCTDYDFRTDMLKSGNFNQNAFDTLINYNRLMDLKESLR